MKLSKKDKQEAIRQLNNFNLTPELRTIVDTFMLWDPSSENEQEVYDALNWAILTLKVQQATLTVINSTHTLEEREKISEMTAELLAAAAPPEAKPKPEPKKNTFRVINGGK